MENYKRSMFVITHKNIEQKIEAEGFSYLSVGHNETNAEFSDTTGESISEKNPNYCELTGLYWIWKNLDADEVGLCHYRRFFCKRNGKQFDVLDVNELNQLLQTGDIIMPKAIDLYMDYFTFYEKAQRNNALRKCCDFLVAREPQYSVTIQKLLKQTSNHCYNMFYCKKDIIDEYCEWLFDLLFDFEKRIDISDWTSQQQRVYGFLAEFLFNVWVTEKGLKVIEVDVAQSEVFPAPLATDADVINVSAIKKLGYKLLPAVWPLLSCVLVTKTKGTY